MASRSTVVVAAEGALIHDIGTPHPRLKYFDEMTADVAKRSGGTLTLAINPPEGKILYAGKALLPPVLSGKVPATLVNTAHLESLDPRIGFLNQPFAVNDEILCNPKIANAVVKMMQPYLEPSGLQLLGLMRGANSIFVFKDRRIRKPEDLKGLRIRVAGKGVFEDIVRSFDVVPVVLPVSDTKVALARGEIDGVLTSPGGWIRVFGLKAPFGTEASGLLFMTELLVVNKEWFNGLKEVQRRALSDAARIHVTENWKTFKNDDAQLISKFVSQGASFQTVPAKELAAWNKRTKGVSNKFEKDYPDVIKQYQEILRSNKMK